MSGKLAINGGIPVRTKPFHNWPVSEENDLERLSKVLNSEYWGGFGPYVRQFEQEFAKRHDVLDSVAVTNGTVTLLLCLRAIGIKPGDEVIIPALTWIATATSVLEANAVPVMVDVDFRTGCIDPNAVRAAITPRTVAIIPVHLYCCMANMDSIVQIADRHGLAVIEDCAHAHGAKWNQKSAGSIGTLGSFSFQSSKVMTAGEGGAVISNDRVLNDKIFSMRNCGRNSKNRGTPILGGNHRMTEWQGAVLLGQLKLLDTHLLQREKNLVRLRKLLSDMTAIKPFEDQPEVIQRPWYRLGFHYDKALAKGVPLMDFIQAVRAEGVPIEAPYPPLYRNALYHTDNMSWYPENIRKFHCPTAEDLAYERVFNLPHEILLGTAQDLEDVVRAFRKVLANSKEAANLKNRLKAKAKKLLRKVKIV